MGGADGKRKPYEIPKKMVMEAYRRVRAKKGAAGVDEEPIEDFEKDLKDNLYKLWNRMSSGSYFPPPVKAVEIPKKTGGRRKLGIPTVADRVAQTVVKMAFEPEVEPVFLPDSYAYRPGKSAIEAVKVTRERCWRYDWLIEFDVKSLFDTIDHELLMRAVRKHTDIPWVQLYIMRWLVAPFQSEDGELVAQRAGTPQGGVVSPVLANLFLHYAFDAWMARTNPLQPWARFADDGVVHCRTREEAERLLSAIDERLKECGLILHPEKTRIVYCKDDDRRGDYPTMKFDFLGYGFRPRRAKNRYGRFFVSLLPAVSNEACKKMRQTIRGWRMHLRVNKDAGRSISHVQSRSSWLDPVLRALLQIWTLCSPSPPQPRFGPLGAAEAQEVRATSTPS